MTTLNCTLSKATPLNTQHVLSLTSEIKHTFDNTDESSLTVILHLRLTLFFYMFGKCAIRNKLKEAAEDIGLPTFVVADAGRTQVFFPRNNVKLMILL